MCGEEDFQLWLREKTGKSTFQKEVTKANSQTTISALFKSAQGGLTMRSAYAEEEQN